MRRVSLLLAILVVAACTSGPAQSDVVSSVASESAVPLAQSADRTMGELASAADAFCSSPDEATLLAAQESWHEAKQAWEAAEVTIYTGPADMLRTESYVDFEPVSPEGVEELLGSDAVIDVDYVENRSSASRRGLGALELGLFRPLSEASEPRRCELTSASAAVAASSVASMAAGWTQGVEGEPPYFETFTSTMDSTEAVSDVVGAANEILKRQTLFELGAALGVSAPEPDLLAIPEGPAGAGVERYLAQLEGIEATLNAGGEDSLIELIRSRSAEIADQIEASLNAARDKLNEVEGPLVTAVEEEPDLMLGLLDDLTEARDLLGIDVVSLLDLTLGFSDSDGDSG